VSGAKRISGSREAGHRSDLSLDRSSRGFGLSTRDILRIIFVGALRSAAAPIVKTMVPKTLDVLRPGEEGSIIALAAEPDLYRRLAALGLRAGKQVSLLRRARFSGPLLIRVGTTDIMLRARDARCILVQPGSAQPAEAPAS